MVNDGDLYQIYAHAQEYELAILIRSMLHTEKLPLLSRTYDHDREKELLMFYAHPEN